MEEFNERFFLQFVTSAVRVIDLMQCSPIIASILKALLLWEVRWVLKLIGCLEVQIATHVVIRPQKLPGCSRREGGWLCGQWEALFCASKSVFSPTWNIRPCLEQSQFVLGNRFQKYSKHTKTKNCFQGFGIVLLCRFTTVATVLSVYYAMVESHMRYGIVLWATCTNENKYRIFKLQKRAVRYICGIPTTTSCKEYFINLKILTLHSLYILETCLLAKKELRTLKKNGDQHEYYTRNRNNLLLEKHHTKRFENKPRVLNSITSSRCI